MSHIILVSKSYGGGCRKLVTYGRLLCEYHFDSQWSLSVVIMVMYFPFWSYMWDTKACICMVGLFMRMSLPMLHSCVDMLRLMIFRGVVQICYPLFECKWGNQHRLGWCFILGPSHDIVLWGEDCDLGGCYLGVEVFFCSPLVCGTLCSLPLAKLCSFDGLCSMFGFLVMNFSLVIAWIVHPKVSRGELFGLSAVL